MEHYENLIQKVLTHYPKGNSYSHPPANGFLRRENSRVHPFAEMDVSDQQEIEFSFLGLRGRAIGRFAIIALALLCVAVLLAFKVLFFLNH